MASDLKVWLHKDISKLDKLLIILSTYPNSCQLKDIRNSAAIAGFKIPTKWNISDVLGKSEGKAIRTPQGWEITTLGKMSLVKLGVSKISPAAMQVAFDLRDHLEKIGDTQTKEFVREAVACHEAELYRSAVVMAWLGAMDVLHKYVHTNHLTAFNIEATKVFGKKWKTAVSTDDLGKMSEGDFLDRIVAISIIGKNVKTELKTCLDRRNGCGHPNSYKISVNQSAAHIEILLLNVFLKYS